MSLDTVMDLAVRTIAFKRGHPLYAYGTWRLLIRGPWSFHDETKNWWAFAEPYNATGRGLDNNVEGYGDTLEEALLDLVTNINEIVAQAGTTDE